MSRINDKIKETKTVKSKCNDILYIQNLSERIRNMVIFWL